MTSPASWSPPGRKSTTARTRSALGSYRVRHDTGASRSPIVDIPLTPARNILLAATFCGFSGAVSGLFLGGYFALGATLLVGLCVGVGLGLWIGRAVDERPDEDTEE